MAQLITDLEGLQAFKRALNRFSNIIKNADEEPCEIQAIIKKLTCGPSSLNQLIKVASKEHKLFKAIKCCKPPHKPSCDCDEESSCSDKRCGCGPCNPCCNGPLATDLFDVLTSLKDSQGTLLAFHHDACELVKAIIKFVKTLDCSPVPCDKELKCLIANLVCCDRSCVQDDCCEFNNGYFVALVMLISLMFGGHLKRTICLVCKTEASECCEEESSCSSSSSGSTGCTGSVAPSCDDCVSSCTVDPCSPCPPKSLYELSVSGLQMLLNLENQDNMNKWFAIIGVTLGGIAGQL